MRIKALVYLVLPMQRRHREAFGTLRGVRLDLELARRILYWRDVLHEGPVPDVAPDELRRIRGAFLAQGDASDHANPMSLLAERDRILEANREGEYVLWFEADLYDQLQLVQIVARLGELGCRQAASR